MNSDAPHASPQSDHVLDPMVRKLQLWKPLDAEEQAAIRALPYQTVHYEPSNYIVRDGDLTTSSCLLVDGFACRLKLTRDGGRSISAVHMRGDVVDLQNSLLGRADHSVQTISKATVAKIPREAIVALAFAFPNVGLAMWYDTLVDASLFREWILSLARRDADQRIAHLLCEFGVRLEALGLGTHQDFELPMTQDQIGDATGMTSIHVNRTLQDLEARGLIRRKKRSVVVTNWEELRKAGEFDPAYLHLQADTA